MGFYVIITSKEESCDHTCIFKKLMAMPVFPEDLSKNVRFWRNGSICFIFHMFSYILYELYRCISTKIKITSPKIGYDM